MSSTASSEEIKRFMPYLLATAIFMQMLDSTILNTALPAIAEDLNEPVLNMQSAIISYVLTLALFIPVSGYMADRFGTKKIFITALILFSLGSLFCALSQNLLQLDISRVFQGLGGALMTPVARLSMLKTYPKGEIVRAMNYAIVPALIAPILGPLIGGYMVEWVSWHWIFLINIPMGIIGVIFSLRYMPDYKEKNPRLDVKGFFIFGAASLLLSVALELLGHRSNTTIMLALLMSGFMMLYFYFRHAQKNIEALFPLHLMKVRTFRVGVIGNLMTRVGISSIPLLIPLLIQIAFERSPSTAGWIVVPMALAAMFGKTLVLPVMNKFGYRNTLRFNTGMLGILIMSLAIPSLNTNILWYIPVMFFMGILNSIQFTAMNAIAISDLRDYQNSSGNSLLTVNQQLAIGFGIAIGMSVLTLFQNQLGTGKHEVHLAFRLTFITVGFLTFLSAFIFRGLHAKDGDNLKTG